MDTRQARELGNRIAAAIESGELAPAYALLAPVLAMRTPFPLLGCIGEAISARPLAEVNSFLDRIASARTEGGWVVIGSALGQQLDGDFAGAMDRCRGFVIGGDVWYATDILGERVPGPALVADFQPTLARLASWRDDPNRWVRRAVGVAIHFWAKRSRDAAEHVPQVEALLTFLEPMFGEHDLDAVKGVGWALKTLGKYYPDQLVGWLAQQVVHLHRRHRALMLNKALTFFSPDQRARATGASAR